MAYSSDEIEKARQIVWSILGQAEITDGDLATLKANLGGAAGHLGPTGDTLALRAQVELIGAIRKFDRGNEEAQIRLFEAIRHFDQASGVTADANLELGRKVKRLTVCGVIFAATAALLAIGSLWISWLSYQVSLHPFGK